VSRAITIVGFCLCGVLAILLVWSAWRDQDRTAPLGELLDELMVSRAIRMTLVMFWWWLGWHFLVTAPTPV
jgi:hypothetical protein